ncbi:MAG: DEAD/DEAH box helicase [Methylococcales bacterium]|nr:DEAD/DEAH box helicase [Methylococcales bacterium]
MSFDQLNLSAPLLQAITEQGYDKPTPVQEKAIPVILEGKDILAGAQTGTGKTAGFALPLLELLNNQAAKKPRTIRALILTPTRELAAQVHESFVTYGKHTSLFSVVVFGGVSIHSQIKRLQGGTDILVATPGRLLDLLYQKKINLSQVQFFVLDEADRMLDMGFIRDIKKVIDVLPKQRQNLLFSATYSKEIKTLASQLLNDPVEVAVARENTTAERISQRVYPIKKENKRELVSWLIGDGNWLQVLIFVRTKHGADRLCRQLINDGIRCAALHGNKSQGARTKALAAFKEGKITALIATDIAARGLDIDQLPHVINFDLPAVAEDYVHRIGRTGRAGAEGEAISLVTQDEAHLLYEIEKLMNKQIPRVDDTGYETVHLKVAKKTKAKSKTNLNTRKRTASKGRRESSDSSKQNSKHANHQQAKSRNRNR